MLTLSLGSALISAALFTAGGFSQAKSGGGVPPPADEPTLLALNKTIEGRIKGGEPRRYEVVIGEGQYARVKVEQRGVDVVLLFKAPDGRELFQLDTPNGDNGPELLDFIAAHPGRYQMVIAALQPNAPAGAYRVRLAELRGARPDDAGKVARQQTLITAAERENRANELIGKQQLAEAEPLLQEAAALRRSVAGEAYVSHPLNLLGLIYEAQGKNDLALRSFEEALPHLVRQEGEESASVGFVIFKIGRFYLAQNDLARAEPKLLRAVKVLERAKGTRPDILMIAHQSVGDLHRARKRFPDSEAHYLRAIEMARKAQGGQENTNSAFLLKELGKLYEERKDLPRAADSFRKAWAICAQLKAEPQFSAEVLINLVSTENVLGLTARFQNNFDLAEQKGREALELLKRAPAGFWKDNETDYLKMRAHLLNNLAQAHLARNDDKRKDLESAEESLKEALAICEKAMPENEVTALVLTNLGRLYHKRRKYARAEPLLKRAVDLHRSLKSPAPTLFEPVYLLGQLELDQDLPMLAEPLLLEARRLAGQSPGMEAEIDVHLGKLYMAAKDFGRAEDYLQRALKFYEKEAPHSDAAVGVCVNLGNLYDTNGNFKQAENFFTRAVTIGRRMIKPRREVTAAHSALLFPLTQLGSFYIKHGDFERDEQFVREVRGTVEMAGAEGYPLGSSLGLFAGAYTFRGQFARAETLLREALARSKPGTEEAAMVLMTLGMVYTSTANYAAAEEHLKQALAIQESLDPDPSDLIHPLQFLADLYRQQGRYAQSMAQADRGLAIYEKAYGAEHPIVAKQIESAALMHIMGQDYKRAEELIRRRLAIAEKAYGAEHPEVADALGSLCMLYGLKGDFASLRPFRERAVTILEKRQRTVPLDMFQAATLAQLYSFSFDEKEIQKGVVLLAESLARDERGGIFMMSVPKRAALAQMYGLLGDLPRAEQIYKEAVALAEQKIGKGSLTVIQPLKLLGDFYYNKLDYAEAEKYYKEALSAQIAVFGQTHPSVADLLMSVGELDKAKGDLIKPEESFLKALEIRKTFFDRGSNPVIELQIKLADLYRDRGEYARAEQLYRENIVAAEQLNGTNSLPVMNLYFGLGTLYRNKEEYDRAEENFKKAQAIIESMFGRIPLYSWGTLIIPARMYLQQGEPLKARPLLEQALATESKGMTVSALSDAFLRLNLAETYRLEGDYAPAASFASEALATREKLLGNEHPDTILALEALADTRQAQGNLPEAVRLRALAAERAEKNIGNFLDTGSEYQKSQLLVTFNKSTDAIVSLHLRAAPADADAKRLALTTILRRKGRALDAFSDQLASLRQRSAPEDRALLEKLATASTRWTNLVFRSAALAEAPPRPGTVPNLERETGRLEAEIQQLEATLSARSAEFRAHTQTVTIDAVRAALPADAALVEFIAYRPYDPTAKGYKNRFGTTRYAAYVLTREGEEPGFVDLGEARPLDEQAVEWNSLLGGRAAEERVKQAGHLLYQKLFAPLEQFLGGRRRVLLVPDGNLNLVQFAALVDGGGRYLLETYDLGYLSSGRELMRFQEPFASESAAAVIANPAFDVTQPEATCPPQVTVNNQYDFTERCFPSLPGTAREADELSQLLQDARVWTGLQATEANLKEVRRPRLLHVATHGYFWPDLAPAKSSEAAPPGWAGAAQNGSRQANPMIRSGLILAGVKQGLSGAGEDGVLTAQEVAGLNLLGTKLVVLSACKTGLGDAQNGQGVYGLRRALVLAGSETQVMSLWKVSDNATQSLMVTYYKRLQAGEGRTGALRQVQLGMLRGELTPTTTRSEQRRETGDDFDSAARDYRHPYFWAAFIPSGDWRSMDGQ